jgi:Ser/Thr protein kinase RdoA (MazF antagonist)
MNLHADEIADRFALGRALDLTGPHARGHQGEVWRLNTDRGSWAVKRSFAWQDEAELASPAAFQQAAYAAGIATPRVVRSVDGTLLAEVALGLVRVDEWVDLHDADTGIDPVAVGITVAALHGLPSGPLDEVDPWYHEGVGADTWIELIEQLVAAGAPFADHLVGQRDELVAMEALVTGPEHLQTCHRDLWADNVRLGPDGRIWVIDWHDCGPGDPSHELAALLFEYAYTDADRTRAMYDAYVAAGGPGRVTDRHDFSMAVAQLGHILEISCRRWLASPDERPLNEMRVAEFVAKPMSRRIIDGILDVTNP